jgi:hypothetical protein
MRQVLDEREGDPNPLLVWLRKNSTHDYQSRWSPLIADDIRLQTTCRAADAGGASALRFGRG